MAAPSSFQVHGWGGQCHVDGQRAPLTTIPLTNRVWLVYVQVSMLHQSRDVCPFVNTW